MVVVVVVVVEVVVIDPTFASGKRKPAKKFRLVRDLNP